MLRYYVNISQDDWDVYLVMSEFSHNNFLQESIKITHYLLNYNQHSLTHVKLKIIFW